jgi:DNA polymerase
MTYISSPALEKFAKKTQPSHPEHLLPTISVGYDTKMKLGSETTPLVGVEPFPTSSFTSQGSEIVYNDGQGLRGGEVPANFPGAQKKAYLDFETISPVDLGLVGARAYAEAAGTRVLCLSWALDDGPVQVWWPGKEMPADLVAAIAAGCRVVAHNYQFDRAIWDRHMVPLGWPAIPLERWSCTALRCRLARLPAGLEQVAEVLGLPPKDAFGKRFVLSLSKRDLDAEPLTEDERRIVAAYVRQDVGLCRIIDRLLPELPEQWRELFEFDHELNARGMPGDIPAVEKLIVVRDAENLRLNAEFKRLTDGELESPKQVEKLRVKLAGLGVDLPDLQRETLETWVEENPRRSDLPAQLIRNRLDSSHASNAKLDRIIATAQGTGRVRDGFVLHGAHTGRFAGRGVQLQNLKKPKIADPEAMLEQLLDRADGILAGTIDPMRDPGWLISIKEAIANCLRGVFKAPDGWVFVSVDLAQIEARVLCWIAGQENKLALYRAGEDVYFADAKAMDSNSRDLGKLFVLSAGFGASGRVMFTRATGFDVVLSEEEAYEMTDRWRANNAAIVEFWHELFRTLVFVVEMPAEQDPIAFRGLHIWRDLEMLYVQLPSGRCLKYRDPQVELNSYGAPVLSVQLPKNKKLLPISLWHGAATENVVQAIAYDVLVGAMLQMHREDIFLVATIHDEIVALAPVEDAEATRARMVEIMATPPDWAPDLPLAADGFINTRFIKPAKPAHALLAPSAAERWMHCPGSVAAIQALPPEPESSFAAEGTEAHRIFAACLERDLDPVTFTTDFMMLQPLRHALMIARDVIAGRRFKAEIRLDPLPGLGKVWGTADVLVFDEADRISAIIDLKFGASVPVEPDCLQLQVYALLAAQQYGCTFDGIELHIIQPRRQHELGPHRVHQLGIRALTDLFTRLQDAVAATENPTAPRLGGEWCRFCAARPGCPESRPTAPPPLVNPFARFVA